MKGDKVTYIKKVCPLNMHKIKQCLDDSVSEPLPQHQSPQQVVCPTSASSPFTLNSPVSHEHTTPQSVYQTTGSSSSLDSLNSQLYPHISSPIDSSESHHQSQQLHRGIPPPGLHPALYLYAQYSNTSSPIEYPEYIQRNNE
ncbi:hypothetical protein APICC_09965 [Apis cerana cerana]|uniref:Uncharacterized protein n=1 Tax=Apis cerana cerana TaxID=94128 RepID=A0A2A3E9E8_APICC|nr:hypothetical protein APICC_09965 [Apis cerana cerana]